MWHFRPIISWNLPVNHKHRQPFWSFYRVITDKFTLFPSDQCTGPRLLVTRGCCITSPFLSLSTPSHVTILSLSPFSRDCCILSPSFSPPLLTWLLYPVTPLLYPVAHSFSRDYCILSPPVSPHSFSRFSCILSPTPHVSHATVVSCHPPLPTPSHVSVVSCRPLLLTWLLYPVTPLSPHSFSRFSCILSPTPSHVTVVSCHLLSPHPFSRDWCIL